MNFKNRLVVGAVLMSSLAPSVVFARHGDRDDDREGFRRAPCHGPAVVVQPAVAVGGYYPAPAPGYGPRGHYEVRTVPRWVEGRFDQAWVPEVCGERRHGWRRQVVCRGGYYEQRWLPAHYENVPQSVWVADATVYAPGGLGINVRFGL